MKVWGSRKIVGLLEAWGVSHCGSRMSLQGCGRFFWIGLRSVSIKNRLTKVNNIFEKCDIHLILNARNWMVYDERCRASFNR